MVRLRYQNGVSSAVTETFRELSLLELPEVDRVSETTLRGRRVDHRLSVRRVWSLVVTSDMKTAGTVNDVNWFQEFWKAEKRWIQMPYDANPASNLIRVTTDGGRCPITLVEGIVFFPQFGVELFEKESA